MRHAWLAIAVPPLLALTGCATLSGRSQRVALDAVPRGGKVRDADAAPTDPPLATTPAVIELHRASSRQLVFEHPDDATTPPPPPVMVPVECDFRWRVVGLGNTPFLVMSLSVYGAGFLAAIGLDLWTGAAWDCPLVVRAPGGGAAPSSPDASPRHYLVLPPEHDDTAVQDDLARAWRDAMTPLLRPGDTIVLPEAQRTLLTRLGEPRRVKELTRRRLNTLLMETGATHLVTLRWQSASDRTTFRSDVYDAYREQTERAPALAAAHVDTGDGSFRWQTLFEYLHFIPNSVAWLPGYTDVTSQGKPKDREITTSRRSSLPSWVSGWTLASADHPDAYDTWDAHGKLEPTIGLSVVDVDVKSAGGKDATGNTLPDEKHRFGAWLLHADYALGGTAHTPLGAFDLALLGGYAVAWQDRFAHRDSQTRGRVEFGAEITYTAFLGERFYFRTGVQQLSPMRSALETDTFKVNAVTTAWAGLGFYLPETRWWLRSLFQ